VAADAVDTAEEVAGAEVTAEAVAAAVADAAAAVVTAATGSFVYLILTRMTRASLNGGTRLS